MPIESVPQLAFLAVAGIGVGSWLLIRGMASQRDATRIGDTATSRIATLAAGEVQVTGVIEPAEVTLISPLRSQSCVYYHATIDAGGEGPDLGIDLGADLDEERAVGFRVSDTTGDIRVFPRGARWDAPLAFDASTGVLGGEPPGLRLRTGPAVARAELDRAAAVAALLAPPTASSRPSALTILAGAATRPPGASDGRRRYREAILAPGDAVTIVGRAMPFADLADPAESDMAIGSGLAADDPEVLGDIAEARQAGLLEATPEEAWGNAAIPGFGIGRPVRRPELDPGATRPGIATPADAAAAERQFAIAPETLVLASSPGVPLLIAYGSPAAAVERGQGRFLVGLLGAILAIASAMALAVMLSRVGT